MPIFQIINGVEFVSVTANTRLTDLVMHLLHYEAHGAHGVHSPGVAVVHSLQES